MMQVIEQTREEKIKMYMKCTKAKLIDMLLENQRLLSNPMPKVSVWHTVTANFGGKVLK